MYKILFVCHGNICRSPMAEFVMKDIVAKAGKSDEFVIGVFKIRYPHIHSVPVFTSQIAQRVTDLSIYFVKVSGAFFEDKLR